MKVLPITIINCISADISMHFVVAYNQKSNDVKIYQELGIERVLKLNFNFLCLNLNSHLTRSS